MIDEYLSDKLKAISFCSIIFVVFLHSYNLVINMSDETIIIDGGYNAVIQYFVSHGLTRTAVPIFFMISGYLFFNGLKGRGINAFLSKIKKRFSTLLIPYLFWSIFGILIYFILQSVPQSESFFTKLLIRNYDINDYLNKIIFSPIPYQLWFIRDLIILVILSPIIYWSINKTWVVVVFIFLFIWVIDFDLVILSNESLLFFTIGGIINYKNVNISRNTSFWPNDQIIFSLTWLLLICIQTTLHFNNTGSFFLNRLLLKMGILCGIISIWRIYDWFYIKKDITQTKYNELFKYTFFIFVFHEPLLTIIKKALFFFLGKTQFPAFFIFIFGPLITICLSILVAKGLKLVLPKFYGVVTGGR